MFVRPVFWQGKIVAFVSMKAHLIDMGGTVPGGFSFAKRNRFEDGLFLPPTLLYHEDKPIRSAWQLFFDNTRFGEILLTDIKAAYQSLLMGEKDIYKVIERYGLEAFHGSMGYLLDTAEESMRAGLSKIPYRFGPIRLFGDGYTYTYQPLVIEQKKALFGQDLQVINTNTMGTGSFTTTATADTSAVELRVACNGASAWNTSPARNTVSN